VFNALVQWLLLPGLNDTQCGFKLFTAAAVDRVFPLVSVAGWSFDIEALYIARGCGLRVVEIPIEWHYRQESRLRMLRDGPRMLLELVRIRRRAGGGAYGARQAPTRPPRT
jgi:dolichyl-phosphate beta-glucosyltransferase